MGSCCKKCNTMQLLIKLGVLLSGAVTCLVVTWVRARVAAWDKTGISSWDAAATLSYASSSAASSPLARSGGDEAALAAALAAAARCSSSSQSYVRAPANPVLYMNDYRPEDYLGTARVELAKGCEVTAGNVGNLVWMYGGSVLLNQKSHDFLYSSFDDEHAATATAKAFFFPVANIIFNKSVFHREGEEDKKQTLERTIRAVERVNGPTVLVGAGSQAFYQPGLLDHYFDFEEGNTVNSDVSSYKLEAPHLRLLKVLSDRGGYVMARGNYTAAVLRAHGFERVVASGCPSLFANSEPGLGLALAGKLKAVKQRLQQRIPVRIVINLPPYYRPKMIEFLLRLLLENSANRLVLQDERDLTTLHQAQRTLGMTVFDTQVTWFTSVAAWREFMCRFDFVVSGRIHGTMVGLACAVPGFIIAPDWRVKELAEAMMIPHADPMQKWLHGISALKPADAMFALVERVDFYFDGQAFDRNRCEKYKMYRKIFDELALDMNPALERVCVGVTEQR